jgi:predicted secreted protein
MARQLIEQVTDDLDGGRADTTVSFSWEGTAYEIDLSRKNAQAFEKALKPYLSAARKAKGTSGPSRRGSRAGGRSSGRSAAARKSTRDMTAVREWAKENGFEVSERGRVSSKILEAFDSAH